MFIKVLTFEMKLVLFVLISLFGIYKTDDVFEKVKHRTADCTIVKTQQCIADLLKSAPFLFLSGKSTMDVQTRKQFGECVVGISHCTTKLFANTTERSQKQKDFCGDNEDCYDDEEEDEDEYSKYNLKGFFRCFNKHKHQFFEDIAEAVLDVMGIVKNMLRPEKGAEVITPNMIMCHVIKVSLKSMKNISKEKCGGKGELMWLLLDIELKTNQRYVYEMCSLGTLLQNNVL